MDHFQAQDHVIHGRGPGYEVRDTNIASVLKFAAGLALLCILVPVLLWFTLKAMTGGLPEPSARITTVTDAEVQYRNLRRKEKSLLDSNGWADKPDGPVRLKIDRAIDLLAERGLPSTSATKTEIEINSHSGKIEAESSPSESGSDKKGGGPKK